MPQVGVTGCDSLRGSQSAVELCDSMEAWFPNSPPSVGHGGGPHRRRALMRAMTPGCRQLPHISNIFHVSSINIFWFIVFRESVGQGVGIGRVARWKLGLGWMAGAGVIITPASFLMCLDQMIQKWNWAGPLNWRIFSNLFRWLLTDDNWVPKRKHPERDGRKAVFPDIQLVLPGLYDLTLKITRAQVVKNPSAMQETQV